MKREYFDQLSKLTPIVEMLSKQTNEIGMSFSGKKGTDIGLKGFVFLDLLHRINANLEALLLLLKQLAVSQELKSPIALLLRTCLSDVLTGYYLYTFLKDEKTFENEVKVLGLDYVSYMEIMIENEPRFGPKKLSGEKLAQEIHKKKLFIASAHKDLIKSIDEDTGKFIKYKPEELREDSSTELLLYEGMKATINDKSKYERLLRFSSLSDLAYVYVLMRFYAQYQHYGFYNRNVMLLDPFDNFSFIVQSFYYINGAVHSFGAFIDADKALLEKVLNLLDSYKELSGLVDKN